MYKTELKLNRRLCQLVVSLLVGLWAMTPGWVNALPIDGKVVGGTGSIMETTPQQMEVIQTTPSLAIDWQSFNIGAKESVHFDQPDANSIALNRVVGMDPSIILGKLSGNGQVFLSNPSGVVFGKGSVVDVHGLLATTLNINKDDFMNGIYKFSQGQSLVAVLSEGNTLSKGRSLASALNADYEILQGGPLTAVTNDGTINAKSYVGLVAPAVQNNGSIIVADMGAVVLASGTAATVDFNGDGLISFVVTEEVLGDVTATVLDNKKLKNRILNSGTIRANGGRVLLTAKSAGKLIGDVVNHSGLIEAQTVQQKDGKIILSSGGDGTIGLSGTLDAPKVVVRADAVTVAANESLSTNNGKIKIVANDLDLKGDLNAGTGDVSFTLANGGDLNLDPGNPNGSLGGNDIGHIIAENLILQTYGDINVKGIREKDTDRITGSVIMKSGRNINFDTVASVFPALELFAITDINVNVDVTTNQGDFIAKADIENNGIGDFNVAPGVVITSARDIDVSAPTINADNDQSFNETRDLILNGAVAGDVPPQPPITPVVAESISQGSLGTFLTEFFENGGPGGC